MHINWFKIYAIGIIFFLFLPLVLIVLFSFNSNRLSVFPLTGITLDWYQEVINNNIFLQGFKNSTIIAVCASIGATLLGTLGAYGLTRFRIRAGGLLLGFLTLPILIPGLVFGIGLLSYFTLLNMRLSLLTVILAHICFSMPYVILIMNSRFCNFDWAIEEAARDLGAGGWDRFRLILSPL